MVKIVFIAHDGGRREIDAEVGMTVMEAAIANDVPGIDADCGGACACATCHVYVDDERLKTLEPRGEMEEDMLDFAAGVAPESRLSCQLRVEPSLEGAVFRTPERQG